MAELTLVALAAGMGRRFGSLKQVAAVGPGDESLIDHTIRDAAQAGVDRVVLVVRSEIRTEVVASVERRSALPVTVVEQPGPGPGRSRPWGAAEAVALGAAACQGPVAVVNADDYYGADGLAALVDWLRSPRCVAGRAALVTWPVEATTPPRGEVTRAVCALAEDGSTLVGMVEHHGVARAGGAIASKAGPIGADAPVSMNLWGLHPSTGPDLSALSATFRRDHPGDPDAELPLPTAIDALVTAGQVTVEALPAGTTWVGVTHPDDLAPARAAMALLAPVPVR